MWRKWAGALAALVVGTSAWGTEINVLSERQEFLLRPFLDRFEQETGIEVNVSYLGKGMLERLQQQPGAIDLVLTTDIANLNAMAEAGLFQPYESAIIEKNVPAPFQDPGNRWTALTARARIIYYSLDRVQPEELNRYEDLADPKWKERICVRSGYHNYNVALVASLIEHHGEAATRAWLEGLKENLARRPQGNDRGQVKAIYEGLCDLSLGNTYYMGAMLADPEQQSWANAVGIFFPNQEAQGTHMNVSGGALVQEGQHLPEALKLLEFLTEEEAQYRYAQVNHEYPVRPGTPLSEIVRNFGKEQPGVQDGVFRQDSLALSKIAHRRTEAIQLLDEVGFDQ